MTLRLSDISHYRSSYDVLGYQLRLVSSIWHRQLNARLSEIDLTEMQFVLLMGLGWMMEEAPQGVSQKTLAEACGCSTALASQVLQKLVRKKLVIVKSDVRDARARIVRLSKSGEARLIEASRILEETDRAFRSDDPKVAERLSDALTAMIRVKIAGTTEPTHDLWAMPVTPAAHLQIDEKPTKTKRK